MKTSGNLEPSLRKLIHHWLIAGIVTSLFLRPGCLKIIQMLPSFQGITVYGADRQNDSDCHREGGVLLAIRSDITSHRRSDLETVSECLWMEMCISGGRNLLIYCCFFAPLVHTCMIDSYLRSLMEKPI